MTWVAVILVIAGTVRLSRLVAKDEITASLRARITGLGDAEHHDVAEAVNRVIAEGEDPWAPDAFSPPLPVGPARYRLGTLLRCPWCNSFWIGIAVVALWKAWPDATLTLMLALAASEAAGLIAVWLDKE